MCVYRCVARRHPPPPLLETKHRTRGTVCSRIDVRKVYELYNYGEQRTGCSCGMYNRFLLEITIPTGHKNVGWPVLATPPLEKKQAEMPFCRVRTSIHYVSSVHPLFKQSYCIGFGPPITNCRAAYANKSKKSCLK